MHKVDQAVRRPAGRRAIGVLYCSTVRTSAFQWLNNIAAADGLQAIDIGQAVAALKVFVGPQGVIADFVQRSTVTTAGGSALHAFRPTIPERVKKAFWSCVCRRTRRATMTDEIARTAIRTAGVVQ